MITHDGTAVSKSGCIVRPLNLIDGPTILGNKRSVVNFEVITDDPCLFVQSQALLAQSAYVSFLVYCARRAASRKKVACDAASL